MKVRSFCGSSTGPAPELNDVPLALAVQATFPACLGTEVGDFIGYKETCCQIVGKRPGEYNLVSWGWVTASECTTKCEL